MTKIHCLTRGCTNEATAGGLCALHGGVADVGLENLENQEEVVGGETEAGETFTAEGGKPEAAVNGEQFQGKPKSCRALNSKGEPCKSTSVDESGLCAAHGRRAPIGTAEDARRAALIGGKRRRERVEARARKVEDAQLGLADLLRVRALERRERLVAALLDAAEQGRDVPALRMIFERLEGKVAERTELVEGLTADELEMIRRSRQYASITQLSDEELHRQLGTQNRDT